ncbi:MAG: biopolymer transporter ExbD [Burkholderiaceae bacterium]|nr:biopolymer transporter ExbD [Burkholderiaceae bacterium]MDO9089652.1 biopolymer transporter ExbD [Burkholderiaceae bacterium]MDP1967912.1 biopolymer transporter ExbD [Burkholderiaceae bacterium]
MAIHFNESNGGDPEVMVEMNTTPLIDVLLVLLVMLIITIPIQLHSVPIEMPVGTPPPNLVPPKVVEIGVTPANQLLWDGDIVDLATLESRLREAAAAAEQPEIHIRPDRHARYEVVAGVLAASQRQGLTRIGLVGAEQFAR